jgi:LPS export ABC transporter permease LptF/LPS export ABC transporter permease LptG
MYTLDRYILRQFLWPFGLSLLVFTFLLTVPTLMFYAEEYFAKGVSAGVFLRLVITLLPQSLALTIPMSLLLALLVAFGRLSADREFVALQACGVSLRRLLRPVGVASLCCAAAAAYVYMVLIPVGNRAFNEITFKVTASSAEYSVRPRVFFEDFPDLVVYVREIPSRGGWEGVFLADRRSETPSIYLARRGRVLVNAERQTAELVLEDGTRHTGDRTDTYQVHRFDQLVLDLKATTMFPGQGPTPGAREMSVPELRARVAELRASGTVPSFELFELHKRFAIPAACLVFGLIGLALGVTNRRDGTFASFLIGVGVIFIYYVVLWFGQSLVKGDAAAPWLAAWLPNLALGGLGLLLFVWRARVADLRLVFPVPRAFQRLVSAHAPKLGLGHGGFAPGILDRYVALTYVRILGLAGVGMALVFYVSTFLDLSEKVFQGNGTWAMLAEFFVFATPQYLYYIVPLAVLLATLVTVAILTKNSELIVMKACGISLYRVAAPMMIGAVAAGTMLFALEQTVLGPANRRAQDIQNTMRGRSASVLSRQWVLGRDGAIYHYNYFDPGAARFIGLSIYEFDEGMRQVTRRTFAERASAIDGDQWRIENGWIREFDAQGDPAGFTTFEADARTFEPSSHFSTEPPDPEFMSFTQLRRYTEQLAASGFDVLRQRVALWRKLSFPFVTVVMTLIAVPFATTFGRSGAMAGIGAGIAIAIVYWTAILFFAAMGAGGVIPPPLAAWAPNLLFGAGAVYLLLTVRT